MATYQDSPWWVAENLSNQNVASLTLGNFWSNTAPSGYQTVHAGSQTDWTAFQSALASGKDVSLHNITWNVVGGPYANEDDALAAIPGIQKAAPAPGAFQQATGVNFSSVTNALTAFWKQLTNYRMWRSLGWLFLGVLLIFVGLFMWVGKEGLKATPIGRIATLGR